MKKETFTLKLAPNWVRFIGTSLVGCLLVVAAVSLKPASAAQEPVVENQSAELSSAQTSPGNDQTTVAQTSAPGEVVSAQNGDIVIPHKQPQLIAQTDSSGVVGDTFGDISKLRQQLLIEPIIAPGPVKPRRAASPGSTAGTPTAFGASSGQAFVGGGLFLPLDDGKADGSLAFGFGVGDSVKSVGLEVAFNIISVGGQKENFADFGDSGTVGFKLHKYFQDGTAVAVAWSNPGRWGEANERAKESIYGVITKSFQPLTVSLGVGSGQGFMSKGAINANENAPNVFAGVGYQVTPAASLVGSWTGNALNLGASFAPFEQLPVTFNTIFTDVSDNLDNGVGFSLSAGYSLKF